MSPSWVHRIEGLMNLAKEMRQDDELIPLEERARILREQRDRFISLIPAEVPPTCRAVITQFFVEMYEQQTKSFTSKNGRILRSL
jgi:hypothetical protein